MNPAPPAAAPLDTASHRARAPGPALLLAGLALGLLSPTPAAAGQAAFPAALTPIPLAAAASAPPELAVSFEEAAVLAAGLTPGGDAVFWSVAREPLGYHQRIVPRSAVVVVDALGEARFALEEGGPVPLKSAWAVADVASGAFAVAAPPGFRLRQVPFPGRAFEVGAPGVVNRLRHELESLYLLVVRPGVGAWQLEAWDRGPKDRSGADDGRVLTSLEDLEPLEPAGPDPPERFAGGDLIVVVEPAELRYYATRLLGAPAPGGGAP